ncbi:Cytochrome P450 734A1 [Platanthera guangdongensis]|uniref:Cytochrome P450 734A1 n=1 Tax=Platanthera guangdongensis TaxID=2320717 RepID=A0ABR2LLS1_9ASPA
MAGSAQRMLEQWKEENEGRRVFEIDVHKQLHNFTADIISRVAFGNSYDECKRIFQLQDEQMHHVSRAIWHIYIPGFRYEIVEECKAFYFVGKETGANFLTWVLILLASHADWQEKAREEVIQICGQQHVPDAEDLGKLNLVNMILYETLRLYPSVMSLTRQTCKNIKLGLINIPAGTQHYIPILAIHHDVKIWGEEANEFNTAQDFQTQRSIWLHLFHSGWVLESVLGGT